MYVNYYLSNTKEIEMKRITNNENILTKHVQTESI